MNCGDLDEDILELEIKERNEYNELLKQKIEHAIEMKTERLDNLNKKMECVLSEMREDMMSGNYCPKRYLNIFRLILYQERNVLDDSMTIEIKKRLPEMYKKSYGTCICKKYDSDLKNYCTDYCSDSWKSLYVCSNRKHVFKQFPLLQDLLSNVYSDVKKPVIKHLLRTAGDKKISNTDLVLVSFHFSSFEDITIGRLKCYIFLESANFIMKHLLYLAKLVNPDLVYQRFLKARDNIPKSELKRFLENNNLDTDIVDVWEFEFRKLTTRYLLDTI